MHGGGRSLSRQQRRAAARRRKRPPLAPWLVLPAGAVLGALAAPQALSAATITVTTADDNFVDDDDVSLREAIASVNDLTDQFDEVTANRVGAFGTNDTIVFDAALNGSTIENYDQFTISRPVTIDGPGPANLTVDALYGGRHFYVVPDASLTSIDVAIEGLYLTKGSESYGGSILAQSGVNLTVTDCRFYDNYASASGGAIAVNGEYEGGEPSSLTVQDSTFEYNAASESGGAIAAQEATVTVESSSFYYNGVYNEDGGAIAVLGHSLTGTDSLFKSNYAPSDGGAIAALYADVDLAGTAVLPAELTCGFLYNETELGYGGAVAFRGGLGSADPAVGNDLTITGCSFVENHGEADGGAVFASGYYSGGESLGSATIQGSSFFYNESYASGGAVAASELATVTVETSVFQSNESLYGGDGGALDLYDVGDVAVRTGRFFYNEATGSGGAMNALAETSIEVQDSTFTRNRTLYGGAGGALDLSASGEGSTITIQRSTFYDNRTYDDGGAVDFQAIEAGGTVLIENSTLVNNYAEESGGAVYFGSETADDVGVTIAHSTFYGNEEGEGGAGIFNSDGPTNIAIRNSILANDSSDLGGEGTFDVAFSLVRDTAGATVNDQGGNLLDGPSPDLGPIDDHGGPTPTMLADVCSPTVDAGDPSFTPPPATDQRSTGFARVDGVGTDMGATELQQGAAEFQVGDIQVDEDAGTVTVTVLRLGGTEGEATVAYATSDGSAEEPGDYAATSGQLTWSDGDGEPKTFDVTIIDDVEDEGDETIQVALTVVAPDCPEKAQLRAEIVLGDPANSTITILDDDLAVSVLEIPALGGAGRLLFAALSAVAAVLALRRRAAAAG